MFKSYCLQPITKRGSPICFEWNQKTGEIRGPSAALVIEMSGMALRADQVLGHPYPTPHAMANPLRNASELAVVLGNDWILPPDLAAVYPQFEDDDPVVEIDENGCEKPSGIEPLY